MNEQNDHTEFHIVYLLQSDDKKCLTLSYLISMNKKVACLTSLHHVEFGPVISPPEDTRAREH